MLDIVKLSAGAKIPVVVLATSGSGETGLAHNAAGLSAKLSKGGTSVPFTLTALNWTEGSDGLYYVTLAPGDTDNLGANVLIILYNGAAFRAPFFVRANTESDIFARTDVATSTRATQADILSDATPFQGARVDAAISSRATATDVNNARDSIKGSGLPDIAAVQARLGTPAGVSVSADIAAIDADVANLALEATSQAIKAKTDLIPASPAQEGSVTAINTKLGTPAGISVSADIANIFARTDVATSTRATATDVNNARDSIKGAGLPDIAAVQARLGTPAGASIAADIANINVDLSPVQTVVDAIKLKTDTIPTNPATEATLATIMTAITELLGLGGKNSVRDSLVINGNGDLTSSRLRIYDSAVNATAAGATGLIATYNFTFSYSAPGVLSDMKMVVV